MGSINQKNREALLNAWAMDQLDSLGLAVSAGFRIVPASDDASFRRYFRGTVDSRSFIFVDAPPELEDSESFIRIAARIGDCGVQAPRVFGADLNQGFMMQSDLGDKLYLDVLTNQTEQSVSNLSSVSELYEAAFSALRKMKEIDCTDLPEYNEALLRNEMNLFADWFLEKQMKLTLEDSERETLESVFKLLVDNAIQQPQVFVHRDYHSRNLMVTNDNSPGVIDFQDAVSGPVSYDLVSLLKDCYWRFPRDQVVSWTESHWRSLELDVDFIRFLRWFDLMGMQRHLKCAGIFSRLNLRDGKPAYLRDIPLVIDYILEVTDQYEDFTMLGDWIRGRILPDLSLRTTY